MSGKIVFARYGKIYRGDQVKKCYFVQTVLGDGSSGKVNYGKAYVGVSWRERLLVIIVSFVWTV